MKKQLLFCFLFVLVLTACQKTSSDSTKATTYKVNNVKDETIQGDRPGEWLMYDVDYKGPVQENVSLSVEGLPTGIAVDTTNIDAVMGGIPGFTALIRLKRMGIADTTVSGTFPVKLVCTGSVTGRKEYPFNLKVEKRLLGLGGGSVMTDLLGIWGHSLIKDPRTGSGSMKNYIDTLTGGSLDTIYLGNMSSFSRGYALFYIDGTLKIPSQYVADLHLFGSPNCCYDVNGTGIYSSSRISFSIRFKFKYHGASGDYYSNNSVRYDINMER